MTNTTTDVLDRPARNGPIRDPRVDPVGATAQVEPVVELVQDVDLDLVPSMKIGLRIPYRLLLVAISKWIDPNVPAGGADRYQPVCQALLEEALLSLSDEADRRAHAYANHTLVDDDEQAPARKGAVDARQITIKLSPRAHAIATKLGLRYPKPLTIPRVCEPLLCAELNRQRKDAIDAMQRALDELMYDAVPAGEPPGED